MSKWPEQTNRTKSVKDEIFKRIKNRDFEHYFESPGYVNFLACIKDTNKYLYKKEIEQSFKSRLQTSLNEQFYNLNDILNDKYNKKYHIPENGKIKSNLPPTEFYDKLNNDKK